MNSLSKSFLIGLTMLGMSASALAAPADKGERSHVTQEAGSAKPGERMARHMAALHDKLKLSAAQEPAWTTFSAAVMPHAPMGRPDRAAIAKMTAPERLEKWITLSQERLAAQQNVLSALKTFYAALTPEQRKIFDDNVPGGAHWGMRGKHGHGGMEGMHDSMHGGMGGMHDDMHEQGKP